jgi:hypothetical protein
MVQALLRTLELQQLAKLKGRFALHNGLVLEHIKYSGGQQVYSDPFPKKRFFICHRMDLIMIRPPGIEAGAFIVSPISILNALFCS